MLQQFLNRIRRNSEADVVTAVRSVVVGVDVSGR